MKYRMLALFASIGLVCASLTCISPHAAQAQFKILIFSKTTGFRHDSIPNGIAAIRQLGQQNNFSVDAAEDSSVFTEANLTQYKVVIFLSTTGEILDNNQQAAFERYLRNSGGYAGIHSASDTEYDWPWYGGLVGAYFQSHPAIQSATIKVEDNSHPSTSALPTAWQRNDEWYNFRVNPRGRVKVLASLDETTYSGGGMGSDHPICWCQLYDGGRSWYTAGGHTQQSYSEPLFLQHLLGGIQFAAGIRSGACSAIASVSAASYRTDTLASESITALFGAQLATSTQAAAGVPLPTTLANTSIRVKDSAGNERLAPLFFVSPTQINFLVPSGAANGPAAVTVVKADGAAPSSGAQIASVAPGLFAANANGQGVAAGALLRIKSNGVRTFEPIVQFDPAQNRFLAAPIDLGPTTDECFLLLFGTGFRFRNAQSTTTIKIGGLDLPVSYAGPQGEFAGLDQVNLRLPRELVGRGQVDIELKIDSQSANTVQVAFK